MIVDYLTQQTLVFADDEIEAKKNLHLYNGHGKLANGMIKPLNNGTIESKGINGTESHESHESSEDNDK